MTKEMYTPPEAVVIEFGQEDVVVCSTSVGVDGDTTTDEQW